LIAMDVPAFVSAGAFFPPGDAGLGGLAAPAVVAALVAACDLLLLIDGGGIVRGVAIGNRDLAGLDIETWVGRPWQETVDPGEAEKLAELAAGTSEPGRWRQVNHPLPGGDLPMRYRAVPADVAGGVVAVGRDTRPLAQIQQRALRAQQATERDALRLHAAEARNRLLFDSATDAILMVDALTLVVTDANPAATALAGAVIALAAPDPVVLNGRALTALVHPDDRDAALTLLHAIAAAQDRRPVGVRLPDGRPSQLSATLFRQDQGRTLLVRLQPLAAAIDLAAERPLAAVLERVPDAFVLTDAALGVLAGNGAFLDLVGLARTSDLRGEALSRFLGQPGDDLAALAARLSSDGSVRDFATVVRTNAAAETGVMVTAVTVVDAGAVRHGFSMRRVAAAVAPVTSLPVARSADELADLVGRMPLRDIVRESTDRIERLCIEAALAFTADNRASAAEILGLSRQSLYSKLHRHGLGNLSDNDSAGS
jgi:transcriptional regulator PpsR